MNYFWRIAAVFGLAVLTANAIVSWKILNRIPPPPLTMGQYEGVTNPVARGQLYRQMPVVRAIAAIDNDRPVEVKVQDQLEPVRVRIVR